MFDAYEISTKEVFSIQRLKTRFQEKVDQGKVLDAGLDVELKTLEQKMAEVKEKKKVITKAIHVRQQNLTKADKKLTRLSCDIGEEKKAMQAAATALEKA